MKHVFSLIVGWLIKTKKAYYEKKIACPERASVVNTSKLVRLAYVILFYQ
jgi:hypothetical protein